MSTILRSRSERLVSGGGKGMQVSLPNIEEFMRSVNLGADKLPDILRTILAGDAGEVIRDQARHNINRRSGASAGAVEIRDLRSNGLGVEVGIGDGNHPRSGLSFKKVGELLEGGAPPHMIRARRGSGLNISGRTLRSAQHPGFRGQKVMGRTLRQAANDVELVLVREFWRLAEAMEFDD